MFHRIRSVLLTVAAATMLGHAVACNASDERAPEVKYDVIGKVTVPLSDLDLRKPADARTLLARLDEAAYQACGGNPKFHPSYALTPQRTLNVFRDCRAAAVRRAVNQIGSPALTRVYAESQPADLVASVGDTPSP